MAERQQEHRLELERITVREAANRSWWGLRLGFVITVLVVGVGAAAIFTGRSLAGFGLILADLAVLAGVFVYGRERQHKELQEKGSRHGPRYRRLNRQAVMVAKAVRFGLRCPSYMRGPRGLVPCLGAAGWGAPTGVRLSTPEGCELGFHGFAGAGVPAGRW
jgi:hypothetical protein